MTVILDSILLRIPNVINFGYKLIIAAIIFVVGIKVIKVLSRMIARSFEKVDMEISLRKFLISLANASMHCILLFIIAGQIGINSASIVAILGSAGLALGLALQGSLANFAGSVLILLMKPFKVGDYIVSSEGEGNVISIGLVYTTLNTADNRKVVIPNGSLANTPITNATDVDKRRVDIMVGIGYSSDIKQAKEIITGIFSENTCILKEEGIQTFVDSLADSAVMIGGRGWTATENYWKARWEITEKIKLAFDEAGIEIPFGQLDVHIIK